jgi:hypothetical protein
MLIIPINWGHLLDWIFGVMFDQFKGAQKSETEGGIEVATKMPPNFVG